MTSHQLQSTPVRGYYEYISRIRRRVNVAPCELADESKESMTETTATNSESITSATDNDNTVFKIIDNSKEQSLNITDKNVTEWSSAEVQQWIEEQCQKFELKKATTEKFQLNGQALVLLNKHDFLRRSPDGGEILYYALQRIINPNKSNSVRNGQNTRITEVDSDSEEPNSAADSLSSTKPIIEEPDDPPLQRKFNHNQHYPHTFYRNHAHIHQPIYTIPTTAYYYQPQQHPAYQNTYVYAHPHVHQQQFYQTQPQAHIHFIHQYQPMMAAQGILIELINHEEAKNLIANGVSTLLNENLINNLSSDTVQTQLYLITMNGQRYIMNEEQIRHYANQIQQQQYNYQQQQQQQQQQQTSQDNIFYTTS